MLLRLSEDDALYIATMLEYGIQEAHEDSLAPDPETREYGALAMEAGLRLLREIDPDAALFGAAVRAGAPFDWEGFYSEIEDDGEIETAPLPPDGGVAP